VYINIVNVKVFTRLPGAKYFLPTDDQWYKAAYYDPEKPGGAGYWDYPTRSHVLPSNALITPDPGNCANFNSVTTIGSPYYTTLVGDFENSASAYGTFDQGGNVKEWNGPATDSSLGITCHLRGGSWANPSNQLLASYSGGSDPASAYSNVGFRVASAVPEPGSLIMLSGVVLTALLYWRWKRV